MPFPSPTLEALVPELREIVVREGLNPARLLLSMPVDKARRLLPVGDRQLIMLTDESAAQVVTWQPTSLRLLFRGDRVPPELKQYPLEYLAHFHAIEFWVATLFAFDRPRHDREMEEIYSTIRRRPDGKSLGEMHDWVWRIAALFLGTRVVSEAEFAAIFQRLANSCGTFALSQVSYNYAEYIAPLAGGGKNS